MARAAFGLEKVLSTKKKSKKVEVAAADAVPESGKRKRTLQMSLRLEEETVAKLEAIQAIVARELGVPTDRSEIMRKALAYGIERYCHVYNVDLGEVASSDELKKTIDEQLQKRRAREGRSEERSSKKKAAAR